MEEVVDNPESITRFLRNSSHMRLALGRPHFSAYLPRLPDGDISVYRTSGMLESEVVSLGTQFVGKPESPLRGHCELSAGEFFVEGLNVVAAPNPHERHANDTGWTNDPRNRIVARKLADRAILKAY